MIVTRHISLDNDCLQKMEPYVERHKGNFSAAIREIIDRAGKNSELENISTIDDTLFKWMLNETDGLLIPDNVLNDIIDPMLIISMGKLEDHLKNKFSELEWNVDFSLKYDNDALPSEVLIEIKGAPQKIRFIARMLAQFLVNNSPENVPLEISSVFNLDGGIRVELSKSSKKKATASLVESFGGLNEVITAIKSRPVFWKSVINGHLLSNYNMVTVHRNYFEDLLSGKIPMGEITIETLAKKPIQEIPLKEMLAFVKEVYETSRVVDRVEIDRENLIFFHSYRNRDVIEKLRTSIVSLLEANGHLYDARSTANMVVLTHRPDVGIKINEIVNNLKISNSRVDQDLIMFMAFLKGLKNIPDIPVSLTALGRRIGVSLMQEYEKENNVRTWEHQNFQKALEIIDSKLHRESEWKSEGKNLLYTVRKCSLVEAGNGSANYICQTIRETFKGAMNYAYGSRAELEIKKLLSHGDNCCEVLIRIP